MGLQFKALGAIIVICAAVVCAVYMLNSSTDIYASLIDIRSDSDKINDTDKISHIVDDKSHLQVFIISATANCLQSEVINGLIIYGNPSPNLIRIIVPNRELSSCENIIKMANDTHTKMICISEYAVLPINKSLISGWFVEKGWKLSNRRLGWYLQQLLKLQVLHYFYNELSEYYLIWDADMILIRPYHFFLNDVKDNNTLKMRVNTGGYNRPDKYLKTVLAVTKLNKEGNYKDWQCNSCVTHQMLVKKSIMNTLLLRIADNDNALKGINFSKRLIQQIPNDINDHNRALSEYTLYYEWALFYYPTLFVIDPITRFKRLRPDTTKTRLTDQDKCDIFRKTRNDTLKSNNKNIFYIGLEYLEDDYAQ